MKSSESIYWNPAGLAVLNGTEAYFTHVTHIGETNVNYFSIATRAGSFGNLGFSAKVFSAGDVIVTITISPGATARERVPIASEPISVAAAARNGSRHGIT